MAALFTVIEDREIVKIVRSEPTGAYTRRIWYLYEWLTGRQLDLPNPGKVRAVPIIDAKKQFAMQDGHAPSDMFSAVNEDTRYPKLRRCTTTSDVLSFYMSCNWLSDA